MLLITIVALGTSTSSQACFAEEDWSVFRPLSSSSSAIPEIDDTTWSENPVDTFIYHRLQIKGLTPAPLTDRRSWIRRVTFDLTGLPPSPDDVHAFLSDERVDSIAYSAVAERLLASPRYGERWARHWLDVVRYADTDGFAIDSERPTLWRYRDYVIRVLNEDRPFDRFIREQLAGDEISAESEGIVATSFYRLGVYEADNMVPEYRRQDFLNEITSTVGNAFLGMTMGCARCHDHKYDPITQADYYRLQAFFTPLQRENVPAKYTAAELTDNVVRLKTRLEQDLDKRKTALEDFQKELKIKLAEAEQKKVEEVSNEDLEQMIKKEHKSITEADRKKLATLKKSLDDFDKKAAERFDASIVTVSNPKDDKKTPDTHILKIGDAFNPGEKVNPGFLSAVEPWQSDIFKEIITSDESANGRRKILAEWITSPENPITARVLVNRIWHYHFGRGIVATPNDFGNNGAGPSHPKLLDFLASWFIKQGWRLKPLHRMLVLSKTYRQSITHPQAEASGKIDSENELLWRARFRRLESEAVRDSMLMASGRLNLSQGGPGFYETLPDRMTRSIFQFTWKASVENQRYRRSIYMFQRRNFILPMMEIFDSADMTESCEQRKHSVTAPQALALFNSDFSYKTSRLFAERILAEAGDTRKDQIFFLYNTAYSSPPDQVELDACMLFLKNKEDAYRAENHDDPRLAAVADLCLVIFNTSRFIYLE